MRAAGGGAGSRRLCAIRAVGPERDAHVHRLRRAHSRGAGADRPHRAGRPHRHADPADDGAREDGRHLARTHGRPGQVPGGGLRQPACDGCGVRREGRPQQGGRGGLRRADTHRHRRAQRRHRRGSGHDAGAAGNPRRGHRDEDGGLRRGLRDAGRTAGHGGPRNGAVRLLQGRLRRDGRGHGQGSRVRARERGLPAGRQGHEYHRQGLLSGPGGRPGGQQRGRPGPGLGQRHRREISMEQLAL